MAPFRKRSTGPDGAHQRAYQWIPSGIAGFIIRDEQQKLSISAVLKANSNDSLRGAFCIPAPRLYEHDLRGNDKRGAGAMPLSQVCHRFTIDGIRDLSNMKMSLRSRNHLSSS